MSKTSRIDRLYDALLSGDEFTSGQIRNRFKLANPTAAVNTLRNEGHAIYLNPRGKGAKKVNKYRLNVKS